MTEEEMLEYCKENFPFEMTTEADWNNVKLVFKEGYELGQQDTEEKMRCCGNCGNTRCTSKYRGNSAYHRQSDGYACADNEDWVLRKRNDNN